MPLANVTMTGTTGPDIDITAKVFPNISEIKFDLARSVISIKDAQGKITDFDYAITDTITYTIAGAVASVSID